MRKKIYNLILNPNLLLFAWIFYLLTPLIGSMRFYIYDNYDRLNLFRIMFSAAYRLLPNIILFIFIILIFIWIKYFNFKKLNKKYLLSILLIFVSSIVALIITQYLMYREHTNYPNYLYSSYGFTLLDIKSLNIFILIVISFSASILFINYFNILKIKSDFDLKKSSLLDILQIITPIVFFLAFFILVEQSFITISKLYTYRLDSKAGYAQKFGLQYKYLEALDNKTPEDSLVIIPPQGSKWPSVGNQPVMRYFLFPRRLISGKLVTDNLYLGDVQNAYFVEIDPDKDDTHWPIIDNVNMKISFDEINYLNYKTLKEISNENQIKTYQIIF